MCDVLQLSRQKRTLVVPPDGRGMERKSDEPHFRPTRQIHQ